MRNLVAQLGKTIPGYRQAVEANAGLMDLLNGVTESPAAAFDQVVLGPLQRLPAPEGSHLLVVDALDESRELDAETTGKVGTIVSLLAAKAQRLPPWLKLLVTSRNNPGVRTPLAQTFLVQEINAETIENRDDLRSYCLSRCKAEPLSARLANSDTSAAQLTDLLCGPASDQPGAAVALGKSGGKFLYLVRVLADLEREDGLAVADLAELPPGMDGFYLDAFERRFSRAGRDYDAWRPMLGVLAAALEPLPPATLAAILDGDEPKIKGLRSTLSDFIRGRGKRYAFDHFSVAEWLTREDEEGNPRAGAYAVDLAAAQSSIHHWAMARIDAGKAHAEPYLLRHLAKHLQEDERAAVYGRLMFDFNWLWALLDEIGLRETLVDCSHVADTRAGRLLRAALRNGALAWEMAPRLLSGQLLGRLAQRDIPEFDRLCDGIRRHASRLAPALLPETGSLVLNEALVVTLCGHEGGGKALQVLPDGRLASASEDATMRVWDLTGATEPLVLRGHESDVMALKALPDGRLASASWDNVRVWDLAGGAEPLVLRGHEGGVTALELLPEGRLASTSKDGTVRVWDLAGGAKPLVLRGYYERIGALQLLPEGRLASASDDATVNVWDPAGGADPLVLSGHEDRVTALQLLPDGRLASASWDNTVRVWDLAGGAEPLVLRGHEGAVTALLVLPDGRLASASWDCTVRVWDLARSRGGVYFVADASITTLAQLPENRIAAGDGSGRIHILGWAE